ncbi:HEAT repeat domain-containing protein [Aporhodopirellula aestuarii]|uniref:HEAT repeat domain-containing protein n=1 Tax=Aporhodopirellula aestuarii TaxID=2950107 RepID=A0ABT0U9D8_9BACT|nr:HEAT repeat domain-containing protein [Aporhodopirellula aestuarii]MCM2373386.1 HEAT repeat domain-containing protein [Aporhodopirellula aestuarii]
MALLLAFHSGAAFSDEIPSETEMIAILTSEDTPKADKAITCKRLAVFGSADCIDSVASLLPDPELNSWARIALEAIDDPSSETALLNAVSTTEGLPLVGVIQSLGVKRSADAVDALTEKLASEDELVAKAAAMSLGKIGGNAAIDGLKNALADSRMNVRSVVAEGLIRCAEAAVTASSESSAEATALYDLVLETELPNPRKVEATRGAILSRGRDGIDLLVQSLNSDNKRIRYIALTAARELSGYGVSDALLAARDRVPKTQAALYVIALGDRGESSMLDAMLETIQKPANTDTQIDIKTAALGVVARIGNATCLDALIAAATDSNDVVASAGQSALAIVGDEQVDAEIVSRAKKVQGIELEALIQAIGARRISAIDTLVSAVDNQDTSIAIAAMTALGNVATIDELPILIERAMGTQSGVTESSKTAALKALRAACVRMSDDAECVALLESAMAKYGRDEQLVIVETFAEMGGPDALAAIEKAAMSSSLDLQNAATRLLGGWMTVDAADVLMRISQQPNHVYRIRAVRGYLRIVRQFRMPQKQRNEMTAAAVAIADRDDEKRLILDAASRYPSVAMLKIAVELSEQASIENEAQAVALQIAQKLESTPAVERLLAKLDLQEMDVEITHATYGAPDENVDVTARLQKQVGKLPIILLDNPNYDSNFGGDPAPGKKKQLHIEYRIDGKPGKAVFNENDAIVLPVPN